jgi:hypothetical protein
MKVAIDERRQWAGLATLGDANIRPKDRLMPNIVPGGLRSQKGNVLSLNRCTRELLEFSRTFSVNLSAARLQAGKDKNVDV